MFTNTKCCRNTVWIRRKYCTSSTLLPQTNSLHSHTQTRDISGLVVCLYEPFKSYNTESSACACEWGITVQTDRLAETCNSIRRASLIRPPFLNIIWMQVASCLAKVKKIKEDNTKHHVNDRLCLLGVLPVCAASKGEQGKRQFGQSQAKRRPTASSWYVKLAWGRL